MIDLAKMSDEDLSELDQLIYMKHPRLHAKFSKLRRWRGLFDVYSAEYKSSTIKEKIALFKEIMVETRFESDRIMRILYNYYVHFRKRSDIAHACYDGLSAMLQECLIGKHRKNAKKRSRR